MFIKDEAKIVSRVGGAEELCILASCLLSPMSRNSVLEELRVKRLAVPDRFQQSSKTVVCVWLMSQIQDYHCLFKESIHRPIFLSLH